MKIKLTDQFKHLFGVHKYVYVKRLGQFSHMLRCAICAKKFCMNTSVRALLPWDQEMEDFHRSMGHLDSESE